MIDIDELIRLKKKYDVPYVSGLSYYFKVEAFVWPCDWVEGNFVLGTGYAIQGSVKLFPWQFLPVNSIIHFKEITFIGPVQTGKSLIAEFIIGYIIRFYTLNILLIYAKKDTVRDVLEERLTSMIKLIPCLRKFWSGQEDDLTKNKIRLNHCILRVAAAGIPTDIASFNSGVVYSSELAKWPKKKFDAKKSAEGRTEATRMLGQKTMMINETSPLDDNDLSYKVATKPGTLFIKPSYPCPDCGKYQLFYDKKIREIPNDKGEKDHNPERIRRDNAAFLECEFCGFKIKDEHRLECMFRMRWGIIDYKKDEFKILDVIPDQKGKDIGYLKKQYGVSYLTINWNRLVDITLTFSEHLARYFTALQSTMTDALKTYTNEDEARWVLTKTTKSSIKYLRSKQQKYWQSGANSFIPSGVKIVIYSCDTQDNGFYTIMRGYGMGLESWLLRAFFVESKMSEDKDPDVVLKKFRAAIYNNPLVKKDGTIVPPFMGIIDRGGHRAKDVDYLCGNLPNLYKCIGSPTQKEMVVLQKSGIYHVNTELLSKLVTAEIESNLWHLPWDTPEEYYIHMQNQYYETYIDQWGNKRTKYITRDPDHYRDCENYGIALCNIIDIKKYLFIPEVADDMVDKIGNAVKNIEEEAEQTEEPRDNFMGSYQKHMNEMKKYGW